MLSCLDCVRSPPGESTNHFQLFFNSDKYISLCFSAFSGQIISRNLFFAFIRLNFFKMPSLCNSVPNQFSSINFTSMLLTSMVSRRSGVISFRSILMTSPKKVSPSLTNRNTTQKLLALVNIEVAFPVQVTTYLAFTEILQMNNVRCSMYVTEQILVYIWTLVHFAHVVKASKKNSARKNCACIYLLVSEILNPLSISSEYVTLIKVNHKSSFKMWKHLQVF